MEMKLNDWESYTTMKIFTSMKKKKKKRKGKRARNNLRVQPSLQVDRLVDFSAECHFHCYPETRTRISY